MKRLLSFLTLSILLPVPFPGRAGEAARVWIEHATDLAGPWTKVELNQVPKDPAGNPMLPVSSPRWFFRTQMALVPDGTGATIPLAEVPDASRKQAEAMLERGKEGRDGWPADCSLGWDVFPVYDKAIDGGKTPACLEFKIVRNLPMPVREGFPKNFTEDCVKPDAGSLFISLSDAESPELESTQEGCSITETLWELAGRRDVRVFRFGADFFAAEDAMGNLLANFGTQPFKPDPRLATELVTPLIWEGDDEAGTDSRPEAPKYAPDVYKNYIDFCKDYLTNPVYRKLRERRAVRAKLAWNLEHGVFPEVINIMVGEEKTVLPAEFITGHRLDSEGNASIVRILPGSTSGYGLKLVGGAPGEGILDVSWDDGVKSFAIKVGSPGVAPRVSPRGSFTPGWQSVVEYWVGDYSNQVQYDQMTSNDWAGYVGCGPNAWAILLAWFEREKGLTAAFGNWVTADAPAKYLEPGPSASSFAALKPVVKALRTYCGTFDDPFSDASPTMPGEMPDGVLTYLSFPFMSQMLTRSWKARWSDLFQTLNGGGGATEVRDALQAGRCACVGLGNYWHYGVAYGYRRQEYKLTENGPPLFYRRQLRVNMGWGDSQNSPAWRDFYDTFFSMNLSLKKGPLHP